MTLIIVMNSSGEPPNGGSFIQENKNKTKRVIRFKRIMIQLKQKCTFSEQMIGSHAANYNLGV